MKRRVVKFKHPVTGVIHTFASAVWKSDEQFELAVRDMVQKFQREGFTQKELISDRLEEVTIP